MNINIYEAENTNSYITLPMLPETIEYSSSSRFQEYEVLDLGKVMLPKGRNLCRIAWEGTFPDSTRKGQSYIQKEINPLNKEKKILDTGLKKPEYYINFLESKRKGNKKIELLISDSVINKRMMYIEEFKYKLTSAGDYQYTVQFVDAQDLVFNKSVKRSSKKDSKYKVKSNKETLRDIAKKYYGDGGKYQTIYKANKKLIDQRVVKERKKNKKLSKYAIFKGQVLTIPASLASEKQKAAVLALQKAINKDKGQYKKVTENGRLDSKTKTVMKQIFIRRGKRGEVVKFVQGRVGAEKDGICGDYTVKKIKIYQRKKGLKADGIAGYDTLMKMVK